MVPIKRRIGPRPQERQVRPDQLSDVNYGDSVPGGASQAPVFGFQLRSQARGCTAHTGGSVRKPPTVGPPGVTIT